MRDIAEMKRIDDKLRNHDAITIHRDGWGNTISSAENPYAVRSFVIWSATGG